MIPGRRVPDTTGQADGSSDKSPPHSSTPRSTESADGSRSSIGSSLYNREYLQLGRLGKGGYGRVFKCKYSVDDMIYAVKVVPFDYVTEKEARLREVKAISCFHHPYVMRYYTSWIEDGVPGSDGDDETHSGASACDEEEDETSGSAEKPTHSGAPTSEKEDDTSSVSVQKPTHTLYISLEVCHTTLKDLLKEKTKPDLQTVWRLFREMVEGLSYIHEKGYIHRDLSRDNIFLDGSMTVRIGDFGLAMKLWENENADTLIVWSTSNGNKMYLAPEAEEENPRYCQKSDIYQLGLILLEMLYPTGSDSERYRVLTERKKLGKLPEDWVHNDRTKNLLSRLLDEEPSRRPSASQLYHLVWGQRGNEAETIPRLQEFTDD